MKGIITRLEGDVAVVELEGKIMKNIYLSVLPHAVQDGDAIEFVHGKWRHNHDETQRLKAQAAKKIDELSE
ncbi:MAG: hypothetical protein APF84_12305 [Gracilibacter sp. BRH_c7a]|nr:MAG: hypothetical protein APF84_12305 [Gracilibacter sp. BRH_c7a]